MISFNSNINSNNINSFFLSFVIFISVILMRCSSISDFFYTSNYSNLVFSKGEGGYYCLRMPYLYKLKSNVLLALAEARGKNGRSSCDDFSGTDLVYKRSFDNGKTWSDLQLLYSNSSDVVFNVVGNAAPVQDRITNRILIPFCLNNEEVYLTFSDDDGDSWSNPIHLKEVVESDWKWVGLGPPGSLQLSSNRIIVPGYHTIKIKGDGELSKGHIMYSDNFGKTWKIGSDGFGDPFHSNECQAVQLKNGSILINARTISTHRIQIISDDEGLTFNNAYIVNGLRETIEGCEGSIISNPYTNILYYSGLNTNGIIRKNMSIFYSINEGLDWELLKIIDEGCVSYSSLQLINNNTQLALLYERSNSTNVLFEPDQIILYVIDI